MTIRGALFTGLLFSGILFCGYFKSNLAIQREPMLGDDLNMPWIHGAANCNDKNDPAFKDPAFQERRLDEDTYILRQNKCLDFEGPFLYLLFGRNKVLLLDSGSITPTDPNLQVRTTVSAIIKQWLAAHNNRDSIDLVVAHTHSHGDHTFGDSQFRGQPHTTVVSPTLSAVQSFFRFADWPNRTADFDLGGRVLTIVPIPGHEPAHIAVYDRNTKLLLTGDTLYPGILVVNDWRSYQQSVHRLAQFASTHSVSWIMGAHIEMTSRPKECYEIGTKFQPSEHRLQLTIDHLKELDQACTAMANNPHREAHDDFIICPKCNTCAPTH